MKQAFSPYFEADRPAELLYRINGFCIVRCRESGLVYLGNPLSEEELEVFYDVNYFEGDSARRGYASYEDDEPILRENFRRRLKEVKRGLPATDQLQLLDFGCAYGYFLDEAQRSFRNVVGVEINEQVASVGRARFGLDVRSGPSVMNGFASESIDVVTMWDVIEHLTHPRSALLQAERVLRRGGEVHITTGDIHSPLARLLGHRWRLINPPQHICYFSESTLRRLLTDTGFEVLDVRRVGKLVSLRFALFILSYLTRKPITLNGWVARLADRRLYINLYDVISVRARKSN